MSSEFKIEKPFYSFCSSEHWRMYGIGLGQDVGITRVSILFMRLSRDQFFLQTIGPHPNVLSPKLCTYVSIFKYFLLWFGMTFELEGASKIIFSTFSERTVLGQQNQNCWPRTSSSHSQSSALPITPHCSVSTFMVFSQPLTYFCIFCSL